MLNCGSLGFTIETPSGGESSVRLLESGMYGLWQFLSDCKDTCYKAQLEFFRRAVNNEDHRADMEPWYVDMSNQQLDSDTWRVPYEENDKYFPEYYVLPVDADSQRDPADAYEMAQFLLRNGVQVSTLTKDVTVNGTTYQAGSLVVDMYQAKRNYANCVLNLGYDASSSGFPGLYSESVASYPSMRGFDCVAIAKVGAFAGALTKVTEITGSTQVTGQRPCGHSLQQRGRDCACGQRPAGPGQGRGHGNRGREQGRLRGQLQHLCLRGQRLCAGGHPG